MSTEENTQVMSNPSLR